MSSYDYDDGPRRYRSTHIRPRERGEPDYIREETIIERGKGPGPRHTDLVYRGRDDSVEDIPRDFPPPGRNRRSNYRDDYYDDRRRARSAGGRRYSDDYYSDDDRYTDYSRRSRHGRRDDRGYDSDRSDSSHRGRRKSGIEDMLDGLGLGGIVGAIAGKKKRDYSDDRSARSGRSRSRAASRRRHSPSNRSSRSRSRGDPKNTERKWAQAAQAALVAGAVEAFRSRKEPGPWTGEKGKRIATAAIGAGGIDGILDRNPNEKTKRHLVEAVVGGLAANRLANGPRSKSRGRDLSYSPDGRAPRSRSRSIIDRLRGRSQSRPRSVSRGGDGGNKGGVKALAAGGALAAAGTALYERMRSKSRKRNQSRDSSADSYVPSRYRGRGNRRSPQSDTGTAQNGGGRGQDRDRNLTVKDIEAGETQRELDRSGAAGGGGAAAGGGNNNNNNKQGGSDTESSSTTDMENKRKRMRGKELLTAGLATIATIHAAHGVYASMEAHEKRHQLVAEGEMSPEEARKKQTKAWVQDAAAVGIAALGIKGAFSEWKEMSEQRREIHEIEKRKRDRRKKRERQQAKDEKERQERLMQLAQHNPQLAMLQSQLAQQGPNGIYAPMPQIPSYYQQQGGGGGGGNRTQAPEPDQSGNPYASRGGR